MTIERAEFITPVTITSPADFQAATGQARAFLFLAAAWSGNSRSSEVDVIATAQAWQQANPAKPAPLYRIDVTEQEGDVWDAVSDWLAAENQSATLMISGSGPVLWIRNGRVVDLVIHAHYEGRRSLADKTRAAFSSN